MCIYIYIYVYIHIYVYIYIYICVIITTIIIIIIIITIISLIRLVHRRWNRSPRPQPQAFSKLAGLMKFSLILPVLYRPVLESPKGRLRAGRSSGRNDTISNNNHALICIYIYICMYIWYNYA